MTDQASGQSETGAGEVDQMKVQMFIQGIKDNQNLLFGIIGGVVAAGIGASIWALINVAANYQIGWMAVGVGFLVGYAVRIVAKALIRPLVLLGLSYPFWVVSQEIF